MKVIRNSDIKDNGTVIALGDFDGLHLAHMTIIRNAVSYAKEHGLKSGVLLFEQNSKGAKLLTSNSQRMAVLKQENLDFVYLQEFSENFRRLSPREFAQILKEKLNVKAVCVGFDYSFGYRAKGKINDLERLGNEYGFDVLVTQAICIDGELISSSNIRQLIQDGEMEKANKFLGRSFCIEGSVAKGFQNGRKMGIPTANLEYAPDIVLPKNGVYAGITHVNGAKLKSVINVGNNPTFNADKITIESHILDFDRDIYGQNIQIEFIKRLRGDIKFNGIEELKAQINKDIENTRKIMF